MLLRLIPYIHPEDRACRSTRVTCKIHNSRIMAHLHLQDYVFVLVSLIVATLAEAGVQLPPAKPQAYARTMEKTMDYPVGVDSLQLYPGSSKSTSFEQRYGQSSKTGVRVTGATQAVQNTRSAYDVHETTVVDDAAALFPGSGNPIDDCWRSNPNWALDRQHLAECAQGFGKMAFGGFNGSFYIVTDDTDDDMLNPAPGTLRYGVVQEEPLWITFSRDMRIKLQNELLMSSFKTIDGRGHNIHIAGGAGLTLQFISNVIIHGVHIYNLVPTGPAMIRSSNLHVGQRGCADGDAINIFGSHNVWVDHCYFANGPDGLVDVIQGSTAISISNNYFTQHDKVILLGAHPGDTFDTDMEVTVAYNHFGPGLTQRLPRVRYGSAHVVNNMYESWGMYAIGGSESPTVLSEGNVFNAPDGADKQVTKRIKDGGADFEDWSNWNWQSSGDLFLNGAFFTPSGAPSTSQVYDKVMSLDARPASMVPTVTRDAGPLMCTPGLLC